ncbi:T. brucei spp.-specific protein [Trypanosoma brucei gambiense DAL972]|uniref:Uncharacterized protein n=1 Tax=Trypanosoma brucei gambiense (strain MHOM/CI/86/DAL972) TaxID=679716 RepID=C9ZLF6_TRYB9|nr:T. brucei spp.-specific protein [Trypanosoma brucei gambiense DAL972]CBH10165.1 T. brucei spp.-specific protein [Trypanosoma brucei gambiense DAL972]|eukprot:XP_011772455.1 T. brucei spp.-specific protein [Trypanosoma brucei gambiense DAL972]
MYYHLHPLFPMHAHTPQREKKIHAHARFLSFCYYCYYYFLYFTLVPPCLYLNPIYTHTCTRTLVLPADLCMCVSSHLQALNQWGVEVEMEENRKSSREVGVGVCVVKHNLLLRYCFVLCFSTSFPPPLLLPFCAATTHKYIHNTQRTHTHTHTHTHTTNQSAKPAIFFQSQSFFLDP